MRLKALYNKELVKTLEAQLLKINNLLVKLTDIIREILLIIGIFDANFKTNHDS